jgi:putative DNA primase/helicase
MRAPTHAATTSAAAKGRGRAKRRTPKLSPAVSGTPAPAAVNGREARRKAAAGLTLVAPAPAADAGAVAPIGCPAGPTFHLTDAGNADFFAARFGRDLRFDYRRKRWLVFDGHRWKPDADGDVQRRATGAMRARLKRAAEIDDLDLRRQEVAWALTSESRGRLAAMLSLAQALRPIADAGDRWDADPWLLGTPEGVVDLRSGALRPGHRADRLTMTTRAAYDRDAACPRFVRFLEEVFNGDAALVAFLHRAIGYSLTGHTGEQCVFVNYGLGANGKSTLLETLAYVLGDYAHTTPFATFEQARPGSIPNDIAALVNRRFVTASETNEGVPLNEARIKNLSGTETMTGRFLYSEPFSFEPQAKIWLCVNHRPIVRDQSHAFWRRIRLIPFTQTFPVNTQLGAALRDEAPGILAWAVRGCLAWQASGLAAPPSVIEGTEAYARDSNPLAEFVEQACALEADAETGAADLFAHYRQWADRARVSKAEQLGQAKFGRVLAARFERRATMSRNVYLGIARKPW